MLAAKFLGSLRLLEVLEVPVSKSQSLTDGSAEAAAVTSVDSTAGPNWNDPNIPAGDAPPLPRWPLLVAGATWSAWMAFLLVMMVMRLRS